MGFMTARRSVPVAPFKPLGLGAAYDLERSVESLASAADQLRMSFPMEAAEHLWGIANGAAAALHQSEAVHAAVENATPTRVPAPRGGRSSDYAVEDEEESQEEGLQRAGMLPASEPTSSARAVRAVTEVTEVKLGSAVAAAMQAVATATAQTRRVAHKDANVPQLIEEAVRSAREEAASEQRAAVEVARAEARREQRAALETAERATKEASAKVRATERMLVQAQGEAAEARAGLDRLKSDMRVGEAVSAAVLKADDHERTRCHADLSELEADLEQ